jgi:hypothetical protein
MVVDVIKAATSFLNKKRIEIFAAVVATYSYQPLQGSPAVGWAAQCFVGLVPAFVLGTYYV